MSRGGPPEDFVPYSARVRLSKKSIIISWNDDESLRVAASALRAALRERSRRGDLDNEDKIWEADAALALALGEEP
jgi:hypothetical protein